MRRSVSGVVPILVHLAVWSAALAALVLVPSCSAAAPLPVPSPSLVEVPHERSQFSNQWRSLGRAHPAQRVKLLVALKQRNIELLENIALKISDPMHPSYGRHLSIEQVANLIAPMQDDVEKTLRWLDDAGIDEKQRTLTNGRDWIKISTTVDMAEELLQAQFHVFEHKTTRKQLVRLEGSYFLPAHVAEVIDFIGGVHGFPSSHTKQPRSVKVARDPESQPSVTPSIANTRYNVTMQPIKGTNNSQGVAEFAEDFYSPPDLQTFFAQFDPLLKGQVIVDVFGANNYSEGVSLEANLDVQYIMALAPFAPTYFYSYNYPDTDIMLEFLEWVVDLSNDPKPPLVHSVSYGEYGGVYTLRQVYRISAQWMILGTRGVTVFFASGDDGVGCNNAGTQFAFPYPSSPWITMVGSTRLNLNNGRYNETGSDFSSGGFSGDFFRPDWQENAVKYYLSHAPLPPASYWAFNRSGRAMPDVAALGENVQIVEEGQVQGVDGTSCSSPIFAGLVSQLNAVRLSKGKSPLGFINPLLYQTAAQRSDAFYDVTVGNNNYAPCPGFTAFRGWDPVTGLGTPNFKVLLEVVQQLP